MICEWCRFLRMDADGTHILHQQSCPEHPATQPKEDADWLRKHLVGVEIGMWADTVLTIHPKTEMKRVQVLGVEGMTEDGQGSYIVNWIYPHFTLRMERAIRDHDTYGEINVYAVQKIEVNNEQPKSKRQRSRHSIRRGARKSK